MSKIQKKDNFLKLIPVKNPNQKWQVNDEDNVQMIIPRMGFLDRFVRLFKKTPTRVFVDLDAIGSFVWRAIDNTKNIATIADELENQFGSEIKPVYERLGLYINILRNNHWITLEKEVDHG